MNSPRHWHLTASPEKMKKGFVSETPVSSSTTHPTRPRKIVGLRYWMLQVLDECERVAADFAADPVHDLRVALRRCRSLADGLKALDPHPDWKAMKKAGRSLFQRLGALRDIQVMEEWVEKLLPQVDAVTVPAGLAASGATHTVVDAEWGLARTLATSVAKKSVAKETVDQAALRLQEILERREKEEQHEARAALEEFDRKQWRVWAKSLPGRAGRIRPGSPLFKHLALERWTEARQLHARALRNRSQVAFHSLRIGIKRFRYIVENFLPAEHAAWKDGLKEIQDLLGEVHDLDVLWSAASSNQIFPDEVSRQRWHQVILKERGRRIDKYRAKMLGPDSLWQVWRAGLPQGKQIAVLATRRMKLWAAELDPDFPHSERVASLAVQLYDGLLAWGWQPAVDADSARSSLLAAALLHDVGKSEGQKGHHKASFEMIRKHGNPLGWKPEDLERAAVVARFHRGALPTRRHKSLRDLLPDEQKATMQLTAVLRLANALDGAHDGQIRRVQVENGEQREKSDAWVVISAEGYSPMGKSAVTIAAERHLLETMLRRPVVIRSMTRVVSASRKSAGR